MGKKGDKDRTTASAKTIAYQNNSRKAAPLPVENCPWCGTRLKTTSFVLTGPSGRPDSDNPSDLRIICMNAKCAFKGNNPLPIVGVDEPLYRRLPCFVIATVDKFASLPWVGASGALLGGADHQDAAGFYGNAAPGIGQRLTKPLAPPDLIIHDELHLISGPLGTMAGLYETAIDALCTRTVEGHKIRPKIVASTATVRRASDQAVALFARSGVEMFPPQGPDRRDSFFAKTRNVADQPGRLYLGIAAQGRSLKVVLLRTYLALLAASQKMWLEAGGSKTTNNPVDPYMTLLGYFNSLRELGGSRRIVEDEVTSRVSGYREQRRVSETEGSFENRQIGSDVPELTSRESTDQGQGRSHSIRSGLSAPHLARFVDAVADTVEVRLSLTAELVWTGPETAVAHSRDTSVVIAELFESAFRSIIISTFVLYQPEVIFKTLAERTEAIPELKVQLFVHVGRDRRDTRHESEILREFATELRTKWPGKMRPVLYYDPRSLSLDADERATWHAKVVVVDDATSFVTSANFTEWAQQRNVEAGVLVRNPAFARQLRQQFESLVQSRAVLEVPGFR